MERGAPRNIKTRETIIAFMNNFFSRYGRHPTVREISAAAGLSSTSTTAGYLNRMLDEGLIGKTNDTRRSYFVLPAAEKKAV